SAHQALAMATINGARMLRLDDRIGSLQAGKQADMMAVDVSALNFQPMHHPVSQLVYTATGYQVSDVWINGRHLLSDRKFTELDETALRSRVAAWQERISP
ncbi:MAG TPA: amidohydrolase family protein, partial [Pseudomonadales bacterium]|nr:amidohydrolase family protein [Pseudomonadales bacterium]